MGERCIEGRPLFKVEALENQFESKDGKLIFIVCASPLHLTLLINIIIL